MDSDNKCDSLRDTEERHSKAHRQEREKRVWTKEKTDMYREQWKDNAVIQ